MRRGTILPIAVMAFAIVGFLFVMDYTINSHGRWPWSTNTSTTNTANTSAVNTNSPSVVTNQPPAVEINSDGDSKTFSFQADLSQKMYPNQGELLTWDAKKKTLGLADYSVDYLYSELLTTPYDKNVSALACTDTYCLMGASSAGWTYAMTKYQDGKFTDLTSKLYTGENRPHLTDVVWNGSYWLLSGSFGGNSGLMKYDGKTFSQVNIPDSVLMGSPCYQFDTLGWNGKIWLLSGICQTSTGAGGAILTYDGTTFTMVTKTSYQFSSVAWNGKVWYLAGRVIPEDPNATSPVVFQFDGSTLKDQTSSLKLQAGEQVGGITWDGKKWIIGLHADDSAVHKRMLLSYDGKTLKDISSSLTGFKVTDGVGHIRGENNNYVIGAFMGTGVAISMNGQYYDFSDRGSGMVEGIAIHGRKVYIGSNNSSAVVYTFGHPAEQTISSDLINDYSATVNISKVKLTVAQNTPKSTSIDYFVSNAGDRSWTPITPGKELTFSDFGNSLRWRATLKTSKTDVTPTISKIKLEYTGQP